MLQKMDLTTASNQAITEALCKQLNEVRLSRNISQSDLAKTAGVSRSTLTRIADGKSVSLDSFVRVMKALGLSGHLKALLPDTRIRPVERLKFGRKQRQRASKRKVKKTKWVWGDGKG